MSEKKIQMTPLPTVKAVSIISNEHGIVPVNAFLFVNEKCVLAGYDPDEPDAHFSHNEIYAIAKKNAKALRTPLLECVIEVEDAYDHLTCEGDDGHVSDFIEIFLGLAVNEGMALPAWAGQDLNEPAPERWEADSLIYHLLWHPTADLALCLADFIGYRTNDHGGTQLSLMDEWVVQLSRFDDNKLNLMDKYGHFIDTLTVAFPVDLVGDRLLEAGYDNSVHNFEIIIKDLRSSIGRYGGESYRDALLEAAILQHWKEFEPAVTGDDIPYPVAEAA